MAKQTETYFTGQDYLDGKCDRHGKATPGGSGEGRSIADLAPGKVGGKPTGGKPMNEGDQEQEGQDQGQDTGAGGDAGAGDQGGDQGGDAGSGDQGGGDAGEGAGEGGDGAKE